MHSVFEGNYYLDSPRFPLFVVNFIDSLIESVCEFLELETTSGMIVRNHLYSVFRGFLKIS